jgi:hypothetical protein
MRICDEAKSRHSDLSCKAHSALFKAHSLAILAKVRWFRVSYLGFRAYSLAILAKVRWFRVSGLGFRSAHPERSKDVSHLV